MYLEHHPAIWAAFPGLVPGVLLVDDVPLAALTADQLAPLLARARARLATTSEAELPEVQAWRRAFSQLGLKPTQYRSAAEALLRRFRREDTLPTLHPLVDLCNAVSLAFALPVAAFDLDQVSGFIDIRYADGDEQSQAFSGEAEHPDPGEVIFVDAERRVHARRWTFRQSRHSTVSAATRRALVVSEGLHTTAARDVPALFDVLLPHLQAIGCTPSQRALLTVEQSRWHLPMGR